MQPTDEIDLIQKFKDGDISAFEELVRTYQDRIYNLCRYMLQDTQDAQDAAQDAFVKAYTGLKGFKPESALYTWLYRIAVNTCLDHKRKSRPDRFQDESIAEEQPSTEPSAERLYESKEIGQAIQAALQKLPEHLRASIVLKEIDGLSYEEIAAVLDTSIGTVKSRISRAREDMQTLLRKKI